MKIPDQVFETRCRYCFHGRPEAGNQDIPESWLYQQCHRKDLPCNIMGISRPARTIEGECESFYPNVIFGICAYCAFNSQFIEPTYCKLDERPNYRPVYLGVTYGAERRAYDVHSLCTCDKYRPDSYWIDHMRRDAAQGRAPQNFDPETMEPIGRIEESKVAAEYWATLTRKARAEEEAARRAREEKNGQQIEFSLDDFEEE